LAIEVKTHAHIITRNDVEILFYTARHYTSFCERVFLHDFGSTDGTLEDAAKFGVEIIKCGNPEKFDDRDNTKVKNSAWRSTDADWIIMVDADEIIYFPNGVQQTLDAYTAQGLALAKPHGYEMISDVLPTTDGQIYDEIKYGAALIDYDKPVLFAPKLVETTEFSEGAHICSAVLKNGVRIPNPSTHADPPIYLLHFHQIGPIERIARRYDIRTSRLSDANIQNHWGNQKPGMEHAIEKRTFIKSHLQRIIP
jgi:glycosyltransferase involved in cell wall biosynthesis